MDPSDDAAVDWIEATNERRIYARVPELAFVETAHALLGYVRSGLPQRGRGCRVAPVSASAPIRSRIPRPLAIPALGLAVSRGISADDGCYLALSIGYDAVLVTGDRRLAAQADRCALLPGTGPLC